MIKAENIASKEFRKSLYGYDCEQVDRYLDELIVQLKQMEQERLEMASTIEYLVSIVQKDMLSLPVADDIVAPVSPHELMSDTDRHALEEAVSVQLETESDPQEEELQQSDTPPSQTDETRTDS